MIVVGIDPGSVSGALAVLRSSGQSGAGELWDFATVENQVDAFWLADTLRQMKADVVVIERVHSMPKQGVASTFKFGTAYGIIIGVVAALGLRSHLVAPATWKGHFTLAGKDNDAVRALACRRHPMAAPSM